MFHVNPTSGVFLIEDTHGNLVIVIGLLLYLIRFEFGHNGVGISKPIVTKKECFVWKRQMHPWPYIRHEYELAGIIQMTKKATLHKPHSVVCQSQPVPIQGKEKKALL